MFTTKSKKHDFSIPIDPLTPKQQISNNEDTVVTRNHRASKSSDNLRYLTNKHFQQQTNHLITPPGMFESNSYFKPHHSYTQSQAQTPSKSTTSLASLPNANINHKLNNKNRLVNQFFNSNKMAMSPFDANANSTDGLLESLQTSLKVTPKTEREFNWLEENKSKNESIDEFKDETVNHDGYLNEKLKNGGFDYKCHQDKFILDDGIVNYLLNIDNFLDEVANSNQNGDVETEFFAFEQLNEIMTSISQRVLVKTKQFLNRNNSNDKFSIDDLNQLSNYLSNLKDYIIDIEGDLNTKLDDRKQEYKVEIETNLNKLNEVIEQLNDLESKLNSYKDKINHFKNKINLQVTEKLEILNTINENIKNKQTSNSKRSKNVAILVMVLVGITLFVLNKYD